MCSIYLLLVCKKIFLESDLSSVLLRFQARFSNDVIAMQEHMSMYRRWHAFGSSRPPRHGGFLSHDGVPRVPSSLGDWEQARFPLHHNYWRRGRCTKWGARNSLNHTTWSKNGISKPIKRSQTMSKPVTHVICCMTSIHFIWILFISEIKMGFICTINPNPTIEGSQVASPLRAALWAERHQRLQVLGTGKPTFRPRNILWTIEDLVNHLVHQQKMVI